MKNELFWVVWAIGSEDPSFRFDDQPRVLEDFSIDFDDPEATIVPETRQLLASDASPRNEFANLSSAGGTAVISLGRKSEEQVFDSVDGRNANPGLRPPLG